MTYNLPVMTYNLPILVELNSKLEIFLTTEYDSFLQNLYKKKETFSQH